MATKKSSQIQKYEASEYCVVCMGTLKKISRVNGCNHTFCYQCISKWAQKQLRCPVCRKQFNQVKSKGKKILKFIEKKEKVQNNDDGIVRTQQIRIQLTPILFYTQVVYMPSYIPMDLNSFGNMFAYENNGF